MLLYEGLTQVVVVDLPYLALLASLSLAAIRMRHQAVELAAKTGALRVVTRREQACEDMG